MNRAMALCGMLAAAAISHGQTYNFTLNQAASSATWNTSINAPFQTSPLGTSFLLGSYDATSNPTGTKTIPGLFGGNLNANTPVPISAGSISASGSNGSNPVHPAGSFGLNVDTGALTCSLSALNLDLLGGTPGTIGINVSITYDSFRTRQPSCAIIGGFPINLPLGDGQVLSITATQVNASDAGTLASAGGNSYTFAIPMQVTLDILATFNGLPVPIDPQVIPFVLAGTVTLDGDNATISSSIAVDQNQTQPGPFVVPPIAFDEPVCGGHLLLNITLGNVGVVLHTTSTINASGTHTCAVDFDQDGFVTGADFDAFVQAFELGEMTADFDGDGFITGKDFDQFVQAFEAGC